MPSKLVRDLMALAAFVAVWLVAPRAFASDAASLASFALSFSAEASTPAPETTTPYSSTEAPPPPPANPRNAAPVCDPRGATMFAPPPQLQDSEQSLEVTTDCAADGWSAHLSGRQVERGRGPQGQADPISQEPTIASAALPIGCGEGVRVPAPEADRERLRPGHRTLLDRPPRA